MFGNRPLGIAILCAVGFSWAGSCLAQPDRALDYAFDLSVKEDYAQELSVVKPLAEAGDTQAQVMMGNMYAFGQGVKKNEATALEWYSRSAEAQDASGLYALGIIYGRGQGAPQDLVKGYMYLRLAMAADAKPNQGTFSVLGNLRHVKSLMTPDQIAAGDKAVADWRAAHGLPPYVPAPEPQRDYSD